MSKEGLLTLLHLKQALVKDFNSLYVREYTTEWQTQRLIRELELRDLELTNTEEYLTKRDIKTRQATLREVGEWLEKNFKDNDTVDIVALKLFIRDCKKGEFSNWHLI